MMTNALFVAAAQKAACPPADDAPASHRLEACFPRDVAASRSAWAEPAARASAHFVGIAGAGMRSLASLLADRGWRISGSDAGGGDVSALAARGAAIAVGHDVKNVPPNADLVIASDAVGPENCELHRAGELGIPILRYAEALGLLMTGARRLSVAGTHGKSTVTAMAAEILLDARLDPTVVCGAQPVRTPHTRFASGGRTGSKDLVLVEACEYRENFRRLPANLAVITGIEPDHFDYYRSLAEIEQSFTRFARKMPADGVLVSRDACEVSRRVARAARCRRETFGFTPAATWKATNETELRGRYQFTVERDGDEFCKIRLRVPGMHNVLNALAAAALAWHAGADGASIRRGLRRFAGLKRRLEPLGVCGGVTLYDDYAHHPTEIDVTLAALRETHPGRRIVCVYQPHQASRTAALVDPIAASLARADVVAVAEIFRAREDASKRPAVTAMDLARRVAAAGTTVLHAHGKNEINDELRAVCRDGDVLVTMGAGDIDTVSHAFRNGS